MKTKSIRVAILEALNAANPLPMPRNALFVSLKLALCASDAEIEKECLYLAHPERGFIEIVKDPLDAAQYDVKILKPGIRYLEEKGIV